MGRTGWRDVYNFTKQWSYRDGRAADQDQGIKPVEMRKSTRYYEVLYDATARNSHFVEDATYIKLRELSIGYTFDRSQLRRYLAMPCTLYRLASLGVIC